MGSGWVLVTAGGGLATVGLLAAAAFVLDLKKRWFWSVPVVPPTIEMAQQEPMDSCQLFVYLPELKGKVAWRKLGDYPTPVHHCELPVDGKALRIYFKREDMSSDRYGGNKVRTLEFQLACCAAAHSSRHNGAPPRRARVYATGAPGSNQIVAAAVHSRGILDCIETVGLFMMPENANVETGMNMASSYSLVPHIFPNFTIPRILRSLKLLVQALYFTSGDFVLPSGGANPTGALGHVSAALELAEQVRQRLLEEPNRIVVPLGSGCTTSGLIIGICVCRKLGLGFSELRKVHSVGIHQMMALGNGFFPRRMVKELVVNTTKVLADLGGPDVQAEARKFIEEDWVMETTFTGNYGEPTEESLEARQLFGEGHAFVGHHAGVQPPWMCHTFNSKALACLLHNVRAGTIGIDETVVVWSTKSLVQPIGPVDPLRKVRSDSAANSLHHRSETFLSESGIETRDDLFAFEYAKEIPM